jgi:hypothetical protein
MIFPSCEVRSDAVFCPHPLFPLSRLAGEGVVNCHLFVKCGSATSRSGCSPLRKPYAQKAQGFLLVRISLEL